MLVGECHSGLFGHKYDKVTSSERSASQIYRIQKGLSRVVEGTSAMRVGRCCSELSVTNCRKTKKVTSSGRSDLSRLAVEAQWRDLRFRRSSVGMFFDKADLRSLLVLKRPQKPAAIWTALFKQRNLISSNRTLVKAINKLHRQKNSPPANLDSSRLSRLAYSLVRSGRAG
jgi:hypothetical protein